MSNAFHTTSVTLLRHIAMEKTGEDEAAWVRFWELYQPAMVLFAKSLGAGDQAEDVVQDVLVKLVDALRHGGYARQDGASFRAYLKTLIRRQLIDAFRREKARGLGRNVALTEEVADSVADASRDVGAALDEDWMRSCRAAALEHVLTKTALSAQSKSVYRAYALEERPVGEVAKQFGLSRNSVSQIKTRIDRMVQNRIAEYLA